jgi:DNA-binding NtrC family response regulator
MRQFAWPGNLRQLHHCLRTAVALLDEDEKQIDWQHLAFDVAHELGAKVDVNSACKREQRGDMAMTDLAPVAAKEVVHNLRALSLQMIEQALADTDGNVSAAARRLGISRQTMYRKMQER